MPIEANILEKIRNNDPHLTLLDLSHQSLQSSDLHELLDAWEHNTCLTALDMTGNPLGDEGALLLSQNTRLCSLIAVGTRIADKGASALAKHPKLVLLDLSENQVGDLGIAMLAQNHVLQTLKVGGNKITWMGASAFIQNSTLLALDLRGNDVGDRGACALGHNLGLQELKLTDAQVSDEGARGLARHPTLTHLELAYNHIGVQGARALSENTHLLSLNLNYNKIGIKGAGFLANSSSLETLLVVGNEINNIGLLKLVENTVLKHLDLSYNQVSDEGACVLSKNQHLEQLELNYNQLGVLAARALVQHPTLKHLSLRHNLLGDEGALVLAQSETLCFLDLSGNQLSAASALALAQNTTLKSLILSYNHLGNRGAIALARNTTLLELYLSYNEIREAGAIALAQNVTLNILDLNYNYVEARGRALLLKNKNFQGLLISEEQPPKFTKENLGTIFLVSQDLFCIRGYDDTIQFFNPAFSRVLGYRDDELLTKHLSDFLHPHDRAADLEAYRQERQKFPYVGHAKRYCCKDGSYRWIQWNSQAKNKRIYGAGTDISAQRKTQHRLLESEREKAASQAHAEEVLFYSAKQSDFIAHLCHEIRNPLNGIFGNLQVVREHFTALENLFNTQLAVQSSAASRAEIVVECTKIKECLSDMEICAEYERSILNDNLDISKMLDHKLQLSYTVFDLKSVVRDIYRMLTIRAQAKNIALKIELPEEPLILKGDALRIKQILINLVGNAIKFTEEGQVVLCLYVKSHTALLTELEIRVTDTGIGLTEEDIAKLFMRFSQASVSTSDQYGGSGLGLLISKKLAQLMGGDVRIKSQKGIGSTFQAVFQCENVLAEDLLIYHQNKRFSMNALSQLVAVIPQPFIRQPRVLIADDSAMNRKLLLKMLTNKGYACLVAVDGEDAVEKNKREGVDVILMDIIMPTLDGIGATRSIRHREQEENRMPVPIIGLSGNAMDDQRQEALAAGMNEYLTKPCTQEEVICKLITGLMPTMEMSSTALDILSQSSAISPLSSGTALESPETLRSSENITRSFPERLEALEKRFQDEPQTAPMSSVPFLTASFPQSSPAKTALEADRATLKP